MTINYEGFCCALLSSERAYINGCYKNASIVNSRFVQRKQIQLQFHLQLHLQLTDGGLVKFECSKDGLFLKYFRLLHTRASKKNIFHTCGTSRHNFSMIYMSNKRHIGEFEFCFANSFSYIFFERAYAPFLDFNTLYIIPFQ